MANNEELFKKIISHAKEYGFVFPSSEIYDGLSAVYDYGPFGVELKNNIKEYWWRWMTQFHEKMTLLFEQTPVSGSDLRESTFSMPGNGGLLH